MFTRSDLLTHLTSAKTKQEAKGAVFPALMALCAAYLLSVVTAGTRSRNKAKAVETKNFGPTQDLRPVGHSPEWLEREAAAGYRESAWQTRAETNPAPIAQSSGLKTLSALALFFALGAIGCGIVCLVQNSTTWAPAASAMALSCMTVMTVTAIRPGRVYPRGQGGASLVSLGSIVGSALYAISVPVTGDLGAQLLLAGIGTWFVSFLGFSLLAVGGFIRN